MMLALWGEAYTPAVRQGRLQLLTFLHPGVSRDVAMAPPPAGILTFIFYCASLTVNLMLQASAGWGASGGLH